MTCCSWVTNSELLGFYVGYFISHCFSSLKYGRETDTSSIYYLCNIRSVKAWEIGKYIFFLNILWPVITTVSAIFKIKICESNIVTFDISKFFNCVWHTKLLSYRYYSSLISWISYFLSIGVDVDSPLSAPFSSTLVFPTFYFYTPCSFFCISVICLLPHPIMFTLMQMIWPFMTLKRSSAMHYSQAT